MSMRVEDQKQSEQVLQYTDYLERLRGVEPALADEFAGLHAVNEVLEWMQRKGLSSAPVDIVGQDEFSYDFLVEFAPARWLAFGVT
jgi:hypothetical protein